MHAADAAARVVQWALRRPRLEYELGHAPDRILGPDREKEEIAADLGDRRKTVQRVGGLARVEPGIHHDQAVGRDQPGAAVCRQGEKIRQGPLAVGVREVDDACMDAVPVGEMASDRTRDRIGAATGGDRDEEGRPLRYHPDAVSFSGSGARCREAGEGADEMSSVHESRSGGSG